MKSTSPGLKESLTVFSAFPENLICAKNSSKCCGYKNEGTSHAPQEFHGLELKETSEQINTV